MTNSSKVELFFLLLKNNNHQALGKIAEHDDVNIAHSITCSKTVTDVKKIHYKRCYTLLPAVTHKRLLLSSTLNVE